MNTYHVIWTYIANYSDVFKVKANSPEAAREIVYSWYSEDFRAKGKIYVFDTAPL